MRTHIAVDDKIRLDLFTAESFRVRLSSLNGEPFPEQFEIPFAVGKVTPWESVPYEADRMTDSTMVVIKTEKLVIYVRKDSGSFMVETPNGKRLYPSCSTVQIFGARRRTVPAMLIGFIITRRVRTISC